MNNEKTPRDLTTFFNLSSASQHQLLELLYRAPGPQGWLARQRIANFQDDQQANRSMRRLLIVLLHRVGYSHALLAQVFQRSPEFIYKCVVAYDQNFLRDILTGQKFLTLTTQEEWEVFMWIEQRYGQSDERPSTLVGGLSAGELSAALLQNEEFTKLLDTYEVLNTTELCDKLAHAFVARHDTALHLLPILSPFYIAAKSFLRYNHALNNPLVDWLVVYRKQLEGFMAALEHPNAQWPGAVLGESVDTTCSAFKALDAEYQAYYKAWLVRRSSDLTAQAQDRALIRAAWSPILRQLWHHWFCQSQQSPQFRLPPDTQASLPLILKNSDDILQKSIRELLEQCMSPQLTKLLSVDFTALKWEESLSFPKSWYDTTNTPSVNLAPAEDPAERFEQISETYAFEFKWLDVGAMFNSGEIFPYLKFSIGLLNWLSKEWASIFEWFDVLNLPEQVHYEQYFKSGSSAANPHVRSSKFFEMVASLFELLCRLTVWLTTLMLYPFLWVLNFLVILAFRKNILSITLHSAQHKSAQDQNYLDHLSFVFVITEIKELMHKFYNYFLTFIVKNNWKTFVLHSVQFTKKWNSFFSSWFSAQEDEIPLPRAQALGEKTRAWTKTLYRTEALREALRDLLSQPDFLTTEDVDAVIPLTTAAEFENISKTVELSLTQFGQTLVHTLTPEKLCRNEKQELLNSWLLQWAKEHVRADESAVLDYQSGETLPVFLQRLSNIWLLIPPILQPALQNVVIKQIFNTPAALLTEMQKELKNFLENFEPLKEPLGTWLQCPNTDTADRVSHQKSLVAQLLHLKYINQLLLEVSQRSDWFPPNCQNESLKTWFFLLNAINENWEEIVGMIMSYLRSKDWMRWQLHSQADGLYSHAFFRSGWFNQHLDQILLLVELLLRQPTARRILFGVLSFTFAKEYPPAVANSMQENFDKYIKLPANCFVEPHDKSLLRYLALCLILLAPALFYIFMLRRALDRFAKFTNPKPADGWFHTAEEVLSDIVNCVLCLSVLIVVLLILMVSVFMMAAFQLLPKTLFFLAQKIPLMWDMFTAACRQPYLTLYAFSRDFWKNVQTMCRFIGFKVLMPCASLIGVAVVFCVGVPVINITYALSALVYHQLYCRLITLFLAHEKVAPKEEPLAAPQRRRSATSPG